MSNMTLRLARDYPDLNLKMPATVEINLDSMNSISFISSHFKFPVILKAKEATTVPDAHKMSIIFNMSTLEKVLEEKKQMGRKLFLVQEFVNHNATIFKVFVLGKKTNIVRRVSLPNLATEDLNEASTIVFDSQEWKHQLPDKFITNITGKAEFPDQERISKISEALGNICVTLFLTSPSMTERSQFIFTKHDLQQLSMFGFDIITDVETGRFTIVDINYLPDYDGVEDFHSQLLVNLLSKSDASG
eukprot:TRINITY_DN1067_c0_g1_i9.p1 TRINITY_DN1067_c0_g1~~TRINITY_DN1067_c0_g1_i9.p1  ORF type:complete len:246 (-),score=52.95 TRINITY_DN1067_c0_g1_i9:158-895(-)